MPTTTWPEYLRQAMIAARMNKASDLARALDVSDSVVSRWLRGQTQPEVPHLRRLAGILNRPILELLVAAGHLEPHEIDMAALPEWPETPPVDVIEAIEADDRLLPEAKAHFLNQYRLLLRVTEDVSGPAGRKTPSEDGPGLRAVARRRRGTDGRQRT